MLTEGDRGGEACGAAPDDQDFGCFGGLEALVLHRGEITSGSFSDLRPPSIRWISGSFDSTLRWTRRYTWKARRPRSRASDQNAVDECSASTTDVIAVT